MFWVVVGYGILLTYPQVLVFVDTGRPPRNGFLCLLTTMRCSKTFGEVMYLVYESIIILTIALTHI